MAGSKVVLVGLILMLVTLGSPGAATTAQPVAAGDLLEAFAALQVSELHAAEEPLSSQRWAFAELLDRYGGELPPQSAPLVVYLQQVVTQDPNATQGRLQQLKATVRSLLARSEAQPAVVVGVGDYVAAERSLPLEVALETGPFAPQRFELAWDLGPVAFPARVAADIQLAASRQNLTARVEWTIVWLGFHAEPYVKFSRLVLEDRETRQRYTVPLASYGGTYQVIPGRVAYQPLVVPPPSGMTPPLSLLEFIPVPGGEFLMGAEQGLPWNRPRHHVAVGDFFLSRYEVTNREWEQVMGTLPFQHRAAKLPVTGVIWYDALAFCNALSALEGLTPAYTIDGTKVTVDWQSDGYRLPTEAQWEYAAQGGPYGGGFSYAGGDTAATVGW